jgi:hypothetical protein
VVVPRAPQRCWNSMGSRSTRGTFATRPYRGTRCASRDPINPLPIASHSVRQAHLRGPQSGRAVYQQNQAFSPHRNPLRENCVLICIPASRGSPASGASFSSAGGAVRAARGMWLSDLYPKGYSQTRLSTVIVFANSSRGKPRCRFCFGCQRFLWGHFSSWRRSHARVQNDPW